MAISNDELNKLLKDVSMELESIKDIKEPDLSTWTDWNEYVEEQQIGKIVNDFGPDLNDDAVTKKYVEDTLNYNNGYYQFSQPTYVGSVGSWTTRVDEYIKEVDRLDTKPAPKHEEKIKRTRQPSIKKNDRVNTPNGPGNVWGVDRDGTVCVELDSDPTILHEFEKKELKKVK